MFIATFFSHEKRGVASSVFTLAIYWGSGLATASILGVIFLGWRVTFFLFGGVGLVVTLIAIPFVGEADRETVLAHSSKYGLCADLPELWKNKTLVLVLIAFTIRFMAGFSRGFFEPLVFAANYPSMMLYYAILNMVILIVAPVPGFFLASRYADREEQNRPKVRPMIVAISLVIPAVLFPVMYW
jgi:predicted MFS family arabinose efflux permease